MSDNTLSARLQDRFPTHSLRCVEALGETTLEVPATVVVEVMTALRDEPDFEFKQLIDLCGVDYAAYGAVEWETESVSGSGFSRGRQAGQDAKAVRNERRFAVVYHLMSVTRNQRLRVKVFLPDDAFPVIASVVDIWPAANWFEREAFDLFGILFDGHPDLRRILTDYGFVGHPFRKDFPLSGHVEVRYDATKGRVIYEPVSIDPRTLVPRVIRHDSRYGAVAPNDAGDKADG
ncbi:MAG: NADH-quinone oxidoreductase subunit C [Gammaproteobacteria bacterium]|nr:NADH-quinone oxidoreductase subunit C [Gammaproteobacteria bacterium]MCP5137196.1 NADH-quinone oxidoreductase subunit C [Gammaproteobacteria bacterium]